MLILNQSADRFFAGFKIDIFRARQVNHKYSLRKELIIARVFRIRGEKYRFPNRLRSIDEYSAF